MAQSVASSEEITRINFKCTKGQAAATDRLAKHHEMNVSELVRALIERECEHAGIPFPRDLQKHGAGLNRDRA